MRRTKVKRGPQVSKDAFDKMIAAMKWWQACNKRGPEYIPGAALVTSAVPSTSRAPHHYDAILQWHDNLSLDNKELCGTEYEIYKRPGWGERVAEKYADDLPPVQRIRSARDYLRRFS